MKTYWVVESPWGQEPEPIRAASPEEAALKFVRDYFVDPPDELALYITRLSRGGRVIEEHYLTVYDAQRVEQTPDYEPPQAWLSRLRSGG